MRPIQICKSVRPNKLLNENVFKLDTIQEMLEAELETDLGYSKSEKTGTSDQSRRLERSSPFLPPQHFRNLTRSSSL